MRVLSKALKHIRQGDFLKSSLRFIRSGISFLALKALEKISLRFIQSEIASKSTKRDWRGFPLVHKGFILYLWTISQKSMWERHPDLVLRALELGNSVICGDRPLMDLVFEMQYAPGFTKPLLSFREMCNIYLFVKKAAKIPGDIAEVGVYRGGSARIICEAKGDKPLHLFDTFSGLPAPDDSVDVLAEGEMKDTSLEQVMSSLASYPNVFFYKGLFPQTAGPVRDHTFSFVHLDTDLYKSTKDCLEFFYDKMNPGGIILTHDYNSIDTPGVRKAFDEFFVDKPETIVELWDSQCLIVKH